jgi:hypothetical protein
MILECLVTTQDPSGRLNVAPMGPKFLPTFDWLHPVGQTFWLRPFEPSRTLENLRATGAGVLNFTDDVLALAQAALKDPTSPEPTCRPAVRVAGQCLVTAGRCLEFSVSALDPQAARWQCECRVVHVTEHRTLMTFNRAMHAVIEATILATRIGILDDDLILAQIKQLAPLVEKTAGPQQQAAWEWVTRWIQARVPTAKRADGLPLGSLFTSPPQPAGNRGEGDWVSPPPGPEGSAG